MAIPEWRIKVILFDVRKLTNFGFDLFNVNFFRATETEEVVDEEGKTRRVIKYNPYISRSLLGYHRGPKGGGIHFLFMKYNWKSDAQLEELQT